MLYAVHLQAIAMQNLILQNRKEIELYAMKMAAKESHRSGCGWNTHTNTHTNTHKHTKSDEREKQMAKRSEKKATESILQTFE